MNLVADFGSFEGPTQQLCQLVLDQVVTFPKTHDQSDWGSTTASCGTVACVSGWAQLFADGYVQDRICDSRAPHKRGQELLELNDYDSVRLFYMVTEEQARMALKFLANGEQIDWDAVGHKYRSDDDLDSQMNMHKRMYDLQWPVMPVRP